MQQEKRNSGGRRAPRAGRWPLVATAVAVVLLRVTTDRTVAVEQGPS